MIRFTEKSDGTAKPAKQKREDARKRERAIARLRKRIEPKKVGKMAEPNSTVSIEDQKPEPVSKLVSTGAEKRSRGRPLAPKPWIDAGVSRMTWFRRRKKEQGK
jgi:hypothetical protein